MPCAYIIYTGNATYHYNNIYNTCGLLSLASTCGLLLKLGPYENQGGRIASDRERKIYTVLAHTHIHIPYRKVHRLGSVLTFTHIFIQCVRRESKERKRHYYT